MSITKSVEDLLKPRYLIENEWFDCPYPNGTILVQQSHSSGFGPEMWIPGQYTFLQKDLDKYPYLVRKLDWHEDREPEEMPEYLKPVNPKEYLRQFGEVVLQVNKEFSGPYTFHATNLFQLASMPWGEWLPATESEYLNYINTTPSKGGE